MRRMPAGALADDGGVDLLEPARPHQAAGTSGYVDSGGTVHRDGVMRLATARDELIPLRDDRVRDNPAYLTVVLLGRVVTRIGTIEDVHAGIIENFFAADLAFLQDLYKRVNEEGSTRASVTCPECSAHFGVDLSGGRLGES